MLNNGPAAAPFDLFRGIFGCCLVSKKFCKIFRTVTSDLRILGYIGLGCDSRAHEEAHQLFCSGREVAEAPKHDNDDSGSRGGPCERGETESAALLRPCSPAPPRLLVAASKPVQRCKRCEERRCFLGRDGPKFLISYSRSIGP